MKKLHFTIITILFAVSLSAQNIDKRHSFGVSVQFSSFPLTYAYSGSYELSGGSFDLANAFAIGVSGKYEYAFNRAFSLSFEPGYLYTRLSYKEYLTYPEHALVSNTNLNVHQLNIPLIANYKYPVIENVNFIASGGVNALVSLQKEINFSETPTASYVNGLNALNFKSSITPEIVMKAGFEIATKHRIRVNACYYLPLTKNAYYSMNLPIDKIEFDAMRISRLAFELSVLF